MPKRRPDHQPLRTCAVCHQVRSKREMERVVRTADGRAVADPSGRLPGRGTYVCTDSACQASSERNRAIARALGLTGAASATA
ncbi:MAG: YlxR family protein [Candidatus Limnocylindria bacterium]